MPRSAFRFHALLIPLLILAAGLALTHVVQRALHLRAEAALREEFAYRVDDLVINIQGRLATYEEILAGASGLFAASRAVERADFRAYVRALQIESRYPGIQGVGFASWIPAADRARHVLAVRAEGFPGYDIRPAGVREWYSSILYLEPFDWRNQRAFGYDMYSEPVRRAAMERARDEDVTSMSGRVRLVQETEQDGQAGFLMYLPVYRPGLAVETRAQRRAALQGWVYAPFRMQDLMSGLLGGHAGGLGSVLGLQIYDGEGRDEDALMFDSAAAFEPSRALHRVERAIEVYGRRWTVVAHSLPAFDARLNVDEAVLVQGTGVLGSLLLAGIAWLMLTARGRALAIAEGMTEQLRRSEAKQTAVFENMSNAVALFRASDDGRDFYFSAFNRAAERIDGLSRGEVLGRRLQDVFPGVVDVGLPEVMRRVWQSGVAEECPACFYADERISGWRERFVYKLPDGDIAVTFNDVTARKEAELAQERLNRALRLLSDCNTALVHADDEYRLLVEICRLVVDRGGYVMAWVGYVEEDEGKTVRPIAQSGYEAGYLDTIRVTWDESELGRGPTGTAIRTGCSAIIQNVLTDLKMAPWREAALERGYQASLALPLICEGTTLGALSLYARESNAFNADEVGLLEEMANDLAFGIVTLRTRAEHAAAKERVAFLASYDSLTGLPNRLLLRDRFEHAALIAEREGGSGLLAVIYLDLDNFQHVNDGLGHETGDRLLVQAVERLKQWVPQADTIARLSGDEFVMLLSDVGDLAAIAAVANAIRDGFAEPLAVGEHVLTTSFSVGISVFPHDGRDFETLLKRADTAVHNAKENGRNTFRFYTREMNADVVERMRITGMFPQALRNSEFVLYYQPQMDVATGRITGVEALLRWRHPVDGLIPPGRFIPIAEQSGHIVAIGDWVIFEACRQTQAWVARTGAQVVTAVNLSALQFKRGNVLDTVTAALRESALPPHCLELELTESVLLQDIELTMRTLRALKSLGVKLSIDDFGTGYSSLAYLKQLSVDKLKIDQSFVRDMLTDADGASIVKAIIQLGHTLQLKVIAEGVETEAQLAFLGGSGCDQVQGYLFSRPVPADICGELIVAGLPARA
ncbi:MAG: EAL domain-containing protein [Proteobacteria bacterium]|nr:EAL domain-containing protein [Pseudomonadota bacterium]